MTEDLPLIDLFTPHTGHRVVQAQLSPLSPFNCLELANRRAKSPPPILHAHPSHSNRNFSSTSLALRQERAFPACASTVFFCNRSHSPFFSRRDTPLERSPTKKCEIHRDGGVSISRSVSFTATWQILRRGGTDQRSSLFVAEMLWREITLVPSLPF